MTNVKIYGLQRSGTNYLTYLLKENIEDVKVLVNEGGWKHGHYVESSAHHVIVTKNPYSWLVSVYEYWSSGNKIGPDLRGVPFGEFIHNRVYVEAQKGVPYLIRASNPVQHWNNMNFHWLSVQTKSLFVAKYEQLLSEPQACVQRIASAFHGKLRATFVACDKTTIPADEDPKLSEDVWGKAKYYKEEQYLSYFTPELFKFVNEELDLDVMVSLNYGYRGIA